MGSLAAICRLAVFPRVVLCAVTAAMVGGLRVVVVHVKAVLAARMPSLTVTVTGLVAAALVLMVPEIRPAALIASPAGRPVAE